MIACPYRFCCSWPASCHMLLTSSMKISFVAIINECLTFQSLNTMQICLSCIFEAANYIERALRPYHRRRKYQTVAAILVIDTWPFIQFNIEYFGACMFMAPYCQYRFWTFSMLLKVNLKLITSIIRRRDPRVLMRVNTVWHIRLLSKTLRWISNMTRLRRVLVKAQIDAILGDCTCARFEVKR